jgi:hypothetical protein
MKVIKVFESAHRELKIESATSGIPMEVLSSDLLTGAIEQRRKGKLKQSGAEAAPAKKPRKPSRK